MRSLDLFALDKLRQRQSQNLRRSIVETAQEDGLWITRNGRRLLAFCSNDYLNLTQHSEIKRAAAAALERWGTGAGASRLITGSHPLYAELEARLAKLKGTQAACVFGSGYLANTGIIPALVGRDDLILIDELAHSCLWAGARLSGASVQAFRHNDAAHAQQLLAAHRAQHQRALIATEGVFSMDGDLAPLHELGALADKHDAWLMSDDAHGIGVLGGGRGSGFQRCRAGADRSADGHIVESDRQLWRLSVRIAAGDRPDAEPRPHPDLFDRFAAGLRRRRHRRTSI